MDLPARQSATTDDDQRRRTWTNGDDGDERRTTETNDGQDDERTTGRDVQPRTTAGEDEGYGGQQGTPTVRTCFLYGRTCVVVAFLVCTVVNRERNAGSNTGGRQTNKSHAAATGIYLWPRLHKDVGRLGKRSAGNVLTDVTQRERVLAQ